MLQTMRYTRKMANSELLELKRYEVLRTFSASEKCMVANRFAPMFNESMEILVLIPYI